MNTEAKTGKDAEKTSSKILFQNTAETTVDLIGNKIADKIASVGKTKSKKTKMKDKKSRYKKDSKLLMSCDCFNTI